MTTQNWVVVLGAYDPEMREIERLVLTHGFKVLRAMHEGRRAQPRTAYLSDYPKPADRQIWVECRPRNGFAGSEVIIVDHHLPGDPGYGVPAHEYWRASSLGQICSIIEQEPTERLRIIAAADHCLSAAYRNECPGVDPIEIGRWRLESRAKFQKRRVVDVRKDVFSALNLILQAPRIDLGGESVADLRIYQRPIPELPEASARCGLACLAYGTQPGKVSLLGSRGPAVSWFLEHGVAGIDLSTAYGDPARGFAGAYAA